MVLTEGEAFINDLYLIKGYGLRRLERVPVHGVKNVCI